MLVILVVIPKIDYRVILTKKQFLGGNEFRTQNTIIEVLELLGLENKKDFTCELVYLGN